MKIHEISWKSWSFQNRLSYQRFPWLPLNVLHELFYWMNDVRWVTSNNAFSLNWRQLKSFLNEIRSNCSWTFYSKMDSSNKGMEEPTTNKKEEMEPPAAAAVAAAAAANPHLHKGAKPRTNHQSKTCTEVHEFVPKTNSTKTSKRSSKKSSLPSSFCFERAYHESQEVCFYYCICFMTLIWLKPFTF